MLSIFSSERNEIAPVGHIKRMLPIWNPKAGFEVIGGADHFYMGFHEKIESVLSAYL
jgi:hypothetical protein